MVLESHLWPGHMAKGVARRISALHLLAASAVRMHACKICLTCRMHASQKLPGGESADGV